MSPVALAAVVALQSGVIETREDAIRQAERCLNAFGYQAPATPPERVDVTRNPEGWRIGWAAHTVVLSRTGVFTSYERAKGSFARLSPSAKPFATHESARKALTQLGYAAGIDPKSAPETIAYKFIDGKRGAYDPARISELTVCFVAMEDGKKLVRGWLFTDATGVATRYFLDAKYGLATARVIGTFRSGS